MPFAQLDPTSFSKEEIVVALTHSRLGGGHVGVAFHSKDGPRLFHLSWHVDLKLDEFPVEGCWTSVAVALPNKAAKQVVAVIRGIAQRMPKINYGVNFIAAKGSFKERRYCAPKDSDGLTCASFVVEVLLHAGVDLIRRETWEKSAANEEWGNKVVEWLGKTPGVTAEHVDAVKKNVNGLRLIPFEVAGAASATTDAQPVDFKTAQDLAAAAKVALEQECPVN